MANLVCGFFFEVVPYFLSPSHIIDRQLSEQAILDINTNNTSYIFRHIILCNLLTTLIRPNFEKKMDSAQDLVDYNVTLFIWPGGVILQQILAFSPNPIYQILGMSLVIQMRKQLKN